MASCSAHVYIHTHRYTRAGMRRACMVQYTGRPSTAYTMTHRLFASASTRSCRDLRCFLQLAHIAVSITMAATARMLALAAPIPTPPSCASAPAMVPLATGMAAGQLCSVLMLCWLINKILNINHSWHWCGTHVNHTVLAHYAAVELSPGRLKQQKASRFLEQSRTFNVIPSCNACKYCSPS